MDLIRESTLGDLLDTAIDYAGLFPPAALAMERAVTGFLEYRRSPDAWALGHFIVPAARLDELLAALPAEARDFTVSATVGADLEADGDRIERFNRAAISKRVAVVVAEVKVTTPSDAARAAARFAGLSRWYGEVALATDNGWVLDQLVAVGGRAKVRTGGVTAEAFPSPAAVARFLKAVAIRALPFKATAGLHHPVRGNYRLTYAADAPIGMMFGYLNLFAGIHLARCGASPDKIETTLDLTGPGAFRTDGDAVVWAGGRLDRGAARALRRDFDGFGSCSFREPIDELQPATSS